MSEAKIRQRAHILQEISRLKSLSAVYDKDIEECILNLSYIEDRAFLCSTILKEINGSIDYFDGVLAILAISLGKDVLEKCVFDCLNKPQVQDDKKLFLINLLNQAGLKVDPGLIHRYIKNADEVIDMETERFLQMAEINPEAQIDFLDFYFGTNENDRNLLLKSIIDDYSGDLLANILTPLIYSVSDENVLKMCIQGLLNSKSYLAYAPLEWLIAASKNPSIVSFSKRIKNELKIAGLRENISLLEYYSKLFKDSKAHNFFVSPIDGASNFSLVFSRKNVSGSISVFFAVFNLEIGPVSCFGFFNISEIEYENILSRFFKDTDKIPLDKSFGKAIIDEFIKFAQNNNKTVPYELLCWRQLTYDIPAIDIPVADFIKTALKNNNTPVTKFDMRRLINSEYASKWFFTYSKKYPEFITLIDKICALNEKDYEKFDSFTVDFIENYRVSKLYNCLKDRFLFQAYFLKCLEFENLSSLFYALYLNESALKEFYEFSIKKSVYEFFLNLQNLKDNTDKNNIFAKERKIKFFDFNAKLMIKLIEKKWIN